MKPDYGSEIELEFVSGKTLNQGHQKLTFDTWCATEPGHTANS